ncbi:ribonuclease H-like domain-containing protein [Tanacetum coccineum]
MVTRFRVRTNRPTKHLNLHVSSISPLPKSRYKARLVANGSKKLSSVDVDEIFSPVVKPGTIQSVLSLAISWHWPVHHLDVKNAFLGGDLSETVYMHQPSRGLTLFICISVTRDSSGMFLSQRKYATEILERAHMVGYNSSQTLIDTESKLGDDGDPYVHGTLDHGLQLFSSSTSSLVSYSDAGCPVTLRSTSDYCVFLGNILLWSSKRQPTLSRFSVEAKYHGVANAVAETCWLRNILRELHTPLSSTMLVYCDNISAVYLSSNPVQHQRTKHIEIDIHFVRDLVAAGQEFRTNLSDRCPPAPTAGEWNSADGSITRFCSILHLAVRSPSLSLLDGKMRIVKAFPPREVQTSPERN